LCVKCSVVFSLPKSSSGSDQSKSHIGPNAGGSLNLSNYSHTYTISQCKWFLVWSVDVTAVERLHVLIRRLKRHQKMQPTLQADRLDCSIMQQGEPRYLPVPMCCVKLPQRTTVHQHVSSAVHHPTTAYISSLNHRTDLS